LQSEFDVKLPTLAKTQFIIFYCACPHEPTSVSLAEKYREKGYSKGKVLKGGVEAWKEAGYPFQTAK
jgi:rhodanese-related sulfurtransferase